VRIARGIADALEYAHVRPEVPEALEALSQSIEVSAHE
jgi:hypothetical protein